MVILTFYLTNHYATTILILILVLLVFNSSFQSLHLLYCYEVFESLKKPITNNQYLLLNKSIKFLREIESINLRFGIVSSSQIIDKLEISFKN